jgi:hypothetical protein
VLASSPGVYPIIPSGASAANYSIDYLDGVLRVGVASLPPTVEAVIDLRTEISELRQYAALDFNSSIEPITAPIYIESALYDYLGLSESDPHRWWDGIASSRVRNHP